MTNNWLDSKQFWRNKRVTVTGGNGFLGKNIVRKLNERGADVFVADQDRYAASVVAGQVGWWQYVTTAAATGNGIKVLAVAQDLPGHEARKEVSRQ